MINAFIITASGASLVINGVPFTVSCEHKKYQQILDCVRNKQWSDIPDLINIVNRLQGFASGDIEIDPVYHEVYYKGQVVHNTIVEHLLRMHQDGFDIEPMCKFLANMCQNPDPTSVDQLYDWMAANNVTITEDGHLLAYKRVREDYSSFADTTVKNHVGAWVSMPRHLCNSNPEVTCSTGLHFCSYAYLKHYYNGAGRVLILKINPADVVSIPTDYNNSKGRACNYFILGELDEQDRTLVEHEDVIDTPVFIEDIDEQGCEEPESSSTEFEIFKEGYIAGYKDGRGKKAKNTSYDYDKVSYYDDYETKAYEEGYAVGRQAGRQRLPSMYS